jgi:hypothetical protein
LPISPSLKLKLADYYRHYSELYLLDTKGPVPELEKRLLDDTGLEIWRQLRAELEGIYRVLFYSAELGDTFETPENFLTVREEAQA